MFLFGELPPFVRRLLSGTVANIYGQVAISVLQLATVPVLVSTWGASRYGTWVILNTMSAYLVLGDFGFGTAAMADMSLKLGAGDRIGARDTYHSVKVLSAILTTLITLAGIVTWVAMRFLYPADDVVGPYSALTIAVIIFYSALLVQRMFPLAGLRATGHFTSSVFLDNTVFFTDGIAVIGVALLGGGFAACASSAFASRLLGNIATWAYLRYRAPDIEKGFHGASVAEIRRLLTPALAVGTLPAAMAISIQGATLVVGWVISPIAAAIFATTRTICRITVQFVVLVSRVSVPELAYAIGGGRERHVAAIMTANAATVALGVIPITFLLSFFGKDIISLWTLGRIVPTPLFVVLMAVGTLFHACWWTLANLLTSLQLQTRFALHFLVYSVMAMIVSIATTRYLQIDGMAIAIMMLDIAMCFRVGRVLTQSELFQPKIMASQAIELGRKLRLLSQK